MYETGHVDTFARDNLPAPTLCPDFLLEGFEYPEKLNVGAELTDKMVEKGFGDNTALIGNAAKSGSLLARLRRATRVANSRAGIFRLRK